MAESKRPAPRNRILALLPPDEYAALLEQLELVQLESRQLVFDVDRPIEHVYFPEACVVSIVGVMSDGTAVETATIGNEGMAGLPVFLDTDQMSAQAFAQIPGPAFRLAVPAFRAILARSPRLNRALNWYTQALFTFVAQSSACNRVHTMRQRCARWLLHTHDRIGRDEYPLTHQFLSQMLGVRRATVTEAMGGLQESGAVNYEMGRLRIRDRAQLERAACECYSIIVREFDRLLGGAQLPRHPMANPFDGLVTERNDRSLLGDGALGEKSESKVDE
jgi:CRP-like cAMP-binding protein